jgi:hypothetical protein
MLKYKTTFVRNNTNTQFFKGTDEFLLHRDKEYVAKGKIVEIVSSLSADRLTREIVTVFADEQYREEYKKDPIIKKNTTLANLYNAEVDIKKTSVEIE